MTCSEIKREAKKSLKGKRGKGALIVLVYLIVLSVISFILGTISEINKVLAIVGLIIQFIISVPLTFGLTFTFIKLKRSEKVSPFDFISLGFSNFKKSWSVTLSMVVRLIVPTVLVILTIFLVAITEYVPVINLLGAILLLVASVFYLIRSIALPFSVYLAYDKPELSGMETTKKTLEVMKGNVGKAILLYLSFAVLSLLLTLLLFIIICCIAYFLIPHSSEILLNLFDLLKYWFIPATWAMLIPVFYIIIGIFTICFGIVNLFIMPYMQTSLVCFYEKVVESNTSSPIVDETSSQ